MANLIHEHIWQNFSENGKEWRKCMICDKTQRLGGRDSFKDGVIERWDDD